MRGFGCAWAKQSITMLWPATHSTSLGTLVHFGGTIVVVVVVVVVVVAVAAAALQYK